MEVPNLSTEKIKWQTIEASSHLKYVMAHGGLVTVEWPPMDGLMK